MSKVPRSVYFFLILTALLWGGNPVAVKFVVCQAEPEVILFIRLLFMSLVLLGFTLYKEGIKCIPTKQQWYSIISMGVFGLFLNNAFQYTGLIYTSAINCSLLSATTPAVTAAFTCLFMKDKLTISQWLGIVTSLLGAGLIITKGSLSVINGLIFNKGDLLIFLSQVCWAFYSIKGRSVMKTMSPIAVTGWTGLVATCLFAIFTFHYGLGGLTRLDEYGWFSMVYMIIGSGILAFCWWNRGISIVGPNRTTIFINIIPISGMVFAALILHEAVSWQQLMGAILIGLGVCMTTQTLQFNLGRTSELRS